LSRSFGHQHIFLYLSILQYVPCSLRIQSLQRLIRQDIDSPIIKNEIIPEFSSPPKYLVCVFALGGDATLTFQFFLCLPSLFFLTGALLGFPSTLRQNLGLDGTCRTVIFGIAEGTLTWVGGNARLNHR